MSTPLGIFGSSGFVPDREKIRQADREEKSQTLPEEPPTADEASLKAELDETDNRLQQLEQELNNLIKSDSVGVADRLKKELSECRRTKSGLEQQLHQCQDVHAETDRRLQQLEQNFTNLVQSGSVGKAKRLKRELTECMQKRAELQNKLRQCRDPDSQMEFLNPKEFAEFGRNRRQTFQPELSEAKSQDLPDNLDGAPEAVYDNVLQKKYDDCNNQLKLCELQEVTLNATVKKLKNELAKCTEKHSAKESKISELNSQIADLRIVIETQKNKLAQSSNGQGETNKDSTDAKAELSRRVDDLQQVNKTQKDEIEQLNSLYVALASVNKQLGHEKQRITKLKQLNEVLGNSISKNVAENREKQVNLEQEVGHLQEEKDKLHAAKESLREEKDECVTTNKELVEANKGLQAANKGLQEEKQKLDAAKETLQVEKDELGTTNKELVEANKGLQAANKGLQEEKQKLDAAKETLQVAKDKLDVRNNELYAGSSAMRDENDKYSKEINSFRTKNKELVKAKKDLEDQNNALGDANEELYNKNKELNEANASFEEKESRRSMSPQATAVAVPIDQVPAQPGLTRFIENYVKWWVLAKDLTPGEKGDIQRTDGDLDLIYNDSPLIKQPTLRDSIQVYREEVVSVLQSEWHRMKGKDWQSQQNTGVFNSVVNYLLSPDPIDTIEDILGDFEKEYQLVDIIETIKSKRLPERERPIETVYNGGGESKRNTEEPLSTVNTGELFGTSPAPPARRAAPAPPPKPSAPSAPPAPSAPAPSAPSAPPMSDDDGGGGSDVLAFRRSSRLKETPSGKDFYQNYTKVKMKNLLRNLRDNGVTLNITLSANEGQMRRELNRLEGDKVIRGKIVQVLELQPVLRF